MQNVRKVKSLKVGLLAADGDTARQVEGALRGHPDIREVVWKAQCVDFEEHLRYSPRNLALLVVHCNPPQEGLLAARRIRDHFPRLPLLLLLPESAQALASQAFQAGMEDYLFEDPQGLFLKNLPQLVVDKLSLLERREKETHLEGLEDFAEPFRNLFEGAPDAIFLADPQTGLILDANLAACDLFQRPRNDLIGIHQSKLHPPQSSSKARQLFQSRAKDLQRGKTTLVRQEILRSTGEVVPVEIAAQLISVHGRSIIQGVFRDISDRELTLKALKESEEKLNGVLDSMTDCMYMVREDMAIVWANRVSRQFFGRNLVGSHCYDVLRCKDTPCSNCIARKAFAKNRTHEHETVVYDKDGKALNVWVTASVAGRGKGGQPRLVALVMRDITERKRNEETLRLFAQRMSLIRDVEHAILLAKSPREIGTAALQQLQMVMPFRRASIVLFDHSEHTGRLLTERGAEHNRITEMDPHVLYNAYSWETFGQGEVTLLRALDLPEGCEQLSRFLQEAGVASCILTPLMLQNAVIGALNIGLSESSEILEEKVEIAREVATSLAVSIQQARLREQSEKDAATKAMLLREVNHRVKNNLMAIQGILSSERAKLTKKAEFGEVMDKISRQVEGLAAAHDLFSASEWRPVRLSDLAEQVMESTLAGVAEEKETALYIQHSPILVAAAEAHHLALVLNELVTNSVKHGWEPGKKLELHLTLQQKGSEISLTFWNSGPPFPQADEGVVGLGSGLILGIVGKNLQGRLEQWNEEGPHTRIIFESQLTETH